LPGSNCLKVVCPVPSVFDVGMPLPPEGFFYTTTSMPGIGLFE
jgi:hypothetical protein